jgi:ATP-dependent Clp protease ATP-binding subunit ClpX
VQAALLPLMDGSPFVLRNRGEVYEFDASRVLFICAGAFVGLAGMVRARLQSGCQLGFGCLGGDERWSDDEALGRVEAADLERFGFVPEFIGRFASLISLQELTTADLVAILMQTEDSALVRQQRLFAQHGIELQFTPAALEEIALQAMHAGTNARGAQRMLLEAVRHLSWRLPELAAGGVYRAVVDDAVVRGESEPELERGVPQDRAVEIPASRLRRDAAALLKQGCLPPSRPNRPRRPRSKRSDVGTGQLDLPF